jgi:M6 family metalloprotease-like protein
MKKRFIIPFALSILTLLTGCNRLSGLFSSSSTGGSTTSESGSESTKGSSSKSNVTTKKKLSVGTMPNKTEYYLYDTLNFNGLVINAEIYENDVLKTSETITDYTLSDVNGNILTSKTKISEVPVDNYMEVYVNKDGYESTYFNIFIEDVSKYTQSLSVTSKPKTNYTIDDTFSSEGLQVSLITSYYTGKKKNNFSQTIDDYTLTIKDAKNNISNATNYKFSEAGDYTLTISYEGTNDTLTSTIPLYVADDDRQNNIVTLPDYDDDTITFSTISTEMEVSFTNDAKDLEEGNKGYYSPSEVNNAYNITSYRKRNVYGWRYLPTTGDVPLLVIPVVTPGDSAKATTQTWNTIFKSFFGQSTELGYESLHSYYYRSSNKLLNFKGGVTGYFDPSTVDSTYSTISGYNSSTITSLPQLALKWAEDTYNIDATKYDSDSDGYVDGIWLVYLHDYDANNTDTFWAFTSSNQARNGSVTTPVANNFAWASFKFIKGFASSSGDSVNAAIDAHVIIHETGHMLGLNDFYSYGTSSYSPVGEADMMCKNIGDMDPYAKLMLGWITPYIVYGTSGKIKIPSSLEKDAVFVIPYDSKTYQKDDNGKILFNVFDEYLVLDYYSDKDLNASDYRAYSVNHISGNGGRLYHVDARLGSVDTSSTISTGTYGFHLYDDPDEPFTTATNDNYLLQYICNTDTGSRAESNYSGDTSENCFDEIRLISRDKRYMSSYNVANTNSLFRAGDSFDIASYSTSFNKTTVNQVDYYLNCQKAFSTSFKIESIA